MFDRDSLEELQAKLASANAAVAAHPLASDRVTRAHAIIESTDSDDKELVNKKLAEEDLPDLAEIGRLTVRHSVSWWRVNRKRNKIVEKIEKLEA